MKRLNKKTVIPIAVISVLALIGVILCLCIYNGVILLNAISSSHYDVRGADVSSYQGEIDWQVLADQEDISFAFIKATEGSSYVDPRFDYNYTEAQKTHLRVGAYHFFSFDSAGKTQAENFIKTVDKIDGMLPPVIDLEFYGDKQKDPPSKESVHAELDVMIEMLKAHYGINPIIYVTRESYSLYVEGYYSECDIWYRNVITGSGTPDGRAWTFWQYTNRERLNGYKGEEKYIDMNVFCGTKTEFENYGIVKSK